MSNSRRVRTKAPPKHRKELPPSKPYLETRDSVAWRLEEEDTPDEFLGFRLVILNACGMSTDDPADLPRLVIEMP